MHFHLPEKKQKVLVIDDDNSLQRLIYAHLTLHTRLNVIQALDGNSGLIHAKKDNPDLIILDWVLPDIEGVDVLTNLKANNQTRNTPVLMMTGHNKLGDIEGAFKLGATGYLTKPFNLEILREKMKKILLSIR